MVNQLEWMCKQASDVEKMMKAENGKPELLKTVQEMDQKLTNVEFELITKTDANSDDKYFSDAYKVYLNLIWLNGEVGTGAGDVAGGVDYRPTKTSLAVLEEVEKKLAAAQADYRNLMDKEVPVFNRAMAAGGIMPVTAALSTSRASMQQ